MKECIAEEAYAWIKHIHDSTPQFDITKWVPASERYPDKSLKEISKILNAEWDAWEAGRPERDKKFEEEWIIIRDEIRSRYARANPNGQGTETT